MRTALLFLATFSAGLGTGWVASDRHDALPSVSAPVERLPAKRSLFFVPFYGGKASDRAKEAGQLVARAIDEGDPSHCRKAVAEYTELERLDNFAGDYSALRWTCEYLLADEATRAKMASATREARRFVEFFGPDFARIGGMLEAKNGDRPARQGGQFTFVDELIRFNAPLREQWENAGPFMDWLDVKEGEVVADIGAGAGFYTWRFADRVGPRGTVYALELNRQHLAYMRDVVSAEDLDNVKVVQSEPDATGLPSGSVDIVFLCLIYQALYGTVSAEERTAFVEDVKRILKPGGRLVVMESPTADELPPGVPPFGGFSLSRELVLPQLQAYGFVLEKETNPVPQRYALVLRRP